jgi:dipeptidyl aminopeptidase/acylaminoacyl peptidase
MRRVSRIVLRVLFVVALLAVATLTITGVPAPPSFVTQDVPRVSWGWAWKSIALVRRLQQQRTFAAWYGGERRMLVTLGTRRLYSVAAPGAKPEPVSGLPTGATSLRWSRDTVQRYVVYALDQGGSEQYRFYRYDLDSRTTTALTTQAAGSNLGGFDRGGTRWTFASNERNGVDRDIYVMDVRRPETRTLAYRSSGTYSAEGWLDDTHVLVSRALGINRRTLFSLDLETGLLAPLVRGRDAGVRLLDTTRDRKESVLYLAADLDGDFASLEAFDAKSGAISPLVPNLTWDVVAVEALSDERTLALLINEDAQNSLYLFDLRTKTLRQVQNVPGGFISQIAAHPTLPLLALDVVGFDGLSGVWTYDAQANRFEAWAVMRSEDTLPPPEVIHYPTFDQVNGRPRLIPAIVIHTSAGKPGERQPVVIDLHGGPTAQARALVGPVDTMAFNGATVIRPNVRGSSGYGTRYETLDDREHREDAVRDVGALLDWIRTRPDLDSGRVGVVGGSYGGYLALAAMTHYSDRLQCGVDLFGISDFPTFLKESERGFFPEAQLGEYGDARDPQMLRFLESISPARQAERIRVPLLIYQGANDMRVKPQQSRSMAERIRAAGGHVTYIEAPNEGHGINQPLTQFYVGAAWMEFMRRCIRN